MMEGGGLGSNGATLGLFECSVPESDCNIHLGSRRKSLTSSDQSAALSKLTRQTLPLGLASCALRIMQTGRPDMLLGPSIYRRVGEACREGVANLASTGKASFTRREVADECQRVLNASGIEIPLEPQSAGTVQSFSASIVGTCDAQEDRAIRVGSLCALCTGAEGAAHDHFVGVFDGHGGSEASEFLHERVFWEVGSRGPDADVEEALCEAYAAGDAEFNAIAEKEDIKAGCTALTCLVRGDTLHVANVGDSRAVLCSAGKAVPLTTDHNVKNPAEVQAVVARGGKMLRNRVNGVLSVTRALGNKLCRDQLSQRPDVVSRPIAWGTDQFVVLGSDGLFDSLSNSAICEFVAEKQKEIDARLLRLRADYQITMSPAPVDIEPATAEEYLKCSYQRIADELVQYAEASAAGYCDNTTCVIVFLDPKDSLTVMELAEASRVVKHHGHGGEAVISPMLTSLSAPKGVASMALSGSGPSGSVDLMGGGDVEDEAEDGDGDMLESSMMQRPF